MRVAAAEGARAAAGFRPLAKDSSRHWRASARLAANRMAQLSARANVLQGRDRGL
jgi:hypothetical protein